MAVTTTPRDIVTAAYAKSTKNKPGTIATEATELLQVVIRSLRGLYKDAALLNPEYFGTLAIGTLDANGAIDIGLTGDPLAPDPVAAMELISRIEIEDPGTSGLAAGDEVHIVALTDLDAAFAPRVTIRGNIIRQVGTDLADVTSIRVYYSAQPLSPADLDSTLDALWREEFNELLILDLAIYLALKDNRGEEVVGLKEDHTGWYNRFVAQVSQYTSASERGRFGRTVGATKQ